LIASKQVALNELIRNRSENDARVNRNVNNANPDNDLDEDGFVVIKMRKPRTKIINITNEELLSKMKTENENNNVKDHAIDYAIIKDIIEEMMSRF
jgi:phenylalanyl-tRNA synthetase beta subunit